MSVIKKQRQFPAFIAFLYRLKWSFCCFVGQIFCSSNCYRLSTINCNHAVTRHNPNLAILKKTGIRNDVPNARA